MSTEYFCARSAPSSPVPSWLYRKQLLAFYVIRIPRFGIWLLIIMATLLDSHNNMVKEKIYN